MAVAIHQAPANRTASRIIRPSQRTRPASAEGRGPARPSGSIIR